MPDFIDVVDDLIFRQSAHIDEIVQLDIEEGQGKLRLTGRMWSDVKTCGFLSSIIGGAHCNNECSNRPF
jgi:hypothetical protein